MAHFLLYLSFSFTIAYYTHKKTILVGSRKLRNTTLIFPEFEVSWQGLGPVLPFRNVTGC